MKRIQALVAAVTVSGLIGLVMLAIGVNAVLNTGVLPVADAAAPSAVVSAPATQTPAQIEQLQNLVVQYQQREKQYQVRLDQDEAQLQQYQGLLMELQKRGLIRINGDGSIQLRRGGLGNPDN